MEQKELIEKEYELYVLTGEKGKVGTRGPKGKQYQLPVLAYVIKSSNELVKEGATLNWDEEQNFDFQNKTIYLIRCKAKVIAENEATAKPKRLFVEKIYEKDVEDEQLKQVIDQYNTPVIQKDDELGEFILNKKFNIFEGKIDWLGRQCIINLKCVDNLNNFDACLTFLKQMNSNLDGFHHELIEFVSSKLLDTANDWNDNNENAISKEQLIENLLVEYCSINKNGSFEVHLTCGNIFSGHKITVRGDFDGGLKEAIIEG